MATIVDRNIFPVPILANFDALPEGLERFEPLFAIGIPCFLYGAGERTVVHFHGNAQSVTSPDTHLFVSAVSRACGARVALVEYPGFWDDGQKTPKTVRGMYSTCMAATKVLANHFGKVHVLGYSVGTAPSARVCAELTASVESLTLIAPMVSALSVLEDHVPSFRLLSVFSRPFDTLCVRRDASRTSGTRVLVIHGKEDKLIKPRNGKEVAAVYTLKNETKFEEIPDADHEGVVAREECIAAIRDHVTKV